jgi:hypothetical protein
VAIRRWNQLDEGPHVDAFSEADGGAVMSDVALGESGLVAVGLVYGQTEPFATYRLGELPDMGGGDPAEPSDVVIDVDAAVWRSVDGVSWSRVHAEDETFGGDFFDAAVWVGTVNNTDGQPIPVEHVVVQNPSTCRCLRYD